MVLAMAGRDLVVADRHTAEGGRHVLHGEQRPGAMVGRRHEPGTVMEDIRLPAIDEVVLRHGWRIEDLRPWDHDELGWGGNHDGG